MTDFSKLDSQLDQQDPNNLVKPPPFALLDKDLGELPPEAKEAPKSSSIAPSAPADTKMGGRFFKSNIIQGLAGLIAPFENVGSSNPLLNSINPQFQGGPARSSGGLNTLLQTSGAVNPEDVNPNGEVPKLVGAGVRGLTGQLPLAALSGSTANIPGLLKLGAQGVLGGVGGEAAQEAFPNHPFAANLLGSVLGSAAPNALEASAAKFAGVPASIIKAQPPEVNPRIAEVLQNTWQNGQGIEPGINQLFPNMKRSLTQQEQINQMAAKTTGAIDPLTGETPKTFTPQIIDNTFKTIGKGFDQVAAQTGFIPFDAGYAAKHTDIAQRIAESPLSDAEKASLGRMLDKVSPASTAQYNTGQMVPGINGDDYQTLTQHGTLLSDLMKNDNASVKGFAKDIRDNLDNALEKAAPPEVSDYLGVLRQRYKNSLLLSDIADPATGNIDPGKLTKSRIDNYYSQANRGNAGDLSDLMQSAPLLKNAEEPYGKSILANKLIPGAIGGLAVAGAEHFAPEMLLNHPVAAGAALTAGLGLGGGSLASKALMNSAWYKNQLLKQALRQAPTYNPLVSGALAGATTDQK